jgi:Ca2+-binding EF-hand superfamily protein
MLSGINQTSQMASLLFSKLDTKNQGYIEKSDLASAFSQLASSNDSDSSAENVFAALDSDSDGKVTESELSTVLSRLQEQLDGEFNRMRMQGGGHGGPQGMGGMPPPPPPADDAGFTEEELTAQLEEAAGSDSARSELLSKIVDNFEAADSNGDGKVSFQEAMAYDKSTESTTTSEAASSTASSSEAQVMRQIMELLHAYGRGQAQADKLLASQLSVSA